MRRCNFTTFRVLILSLVLVSFRPASAGEPASLIKNGGFEDGFNGWTQHTVQLVEDPRAAHSGRKCVSGQVGGRNQSRLIAQEVDLDANRVYHLSFWMRSPERARSIVHLLYGKRDRIEVIELRRPDKKWRRYEVMIAPRSTGKQTLRFAIPSSFGSFGKPGRVFLDDVEFVALPKPAASTNLTRNDGYNDWPTMAVDGAGDVWVAWISFGDDRDRLKGCVIHNGTERVFEIPTRCDGNILWPQLAADKRGAWLVWTMEVNHQWDVYATKLAADRPSKIVQITDDPSVAAKTCAAVDASGRLWIAWEGNKDGQRDIFCTTFSGGRVGPAARITENPTSDQNPTICATPFGTVYLAWDSFRDSNYDIYARKTVGGVWGREMRLTDEPVIDRRPYLSVLGKDVWIAWDNSTISGYHMSNRRQKRIRLGKIVGDRLITPKGIETRTMLHRYAELGALAMDGEGRLWVTMKRARSKRGDWDTWLQCYSGDMWSKPLLVSGALDGVARRAPVAYANGKLHVVWQSDDRPNRPQRIGYKGPEHSNIFYTCIDPAKHAVPAAALQLTEYKTPREANKLKEFRMRFNEDVAERFTIDYEGEKLKLYWGLFHEHTELSQCNARGDGAPDTNFAEARDIARLDFTALTDHGQDLNPYDWHHMRKVVSVNNDPRRFITYLAQEWGGARKNVRNPKRRGGYGHRNIIFADEHYPNYFDPVDNTPPDKLWKILRGVNQITIPHQLADGNFRTDWYYVDEKNQPVAEIFQNRGSYEYLGTPRQARIFTKGYSIQAQWAKGIVIGVIASPDHGGGNGKAAVFARELTREAILDACRKRRTYGTTAAKILMDVRVNGHLMGEVIRAKPGQPVTVSVSVIGAGKIKRVEVIRDNKFVYTVTPGGKTAKFVFEDSQPRKDRSFYYVRVVQDDNELAWSSPVWVE